MNLSTLDIYNIPEINKIISDYKESIEVNSIFTFTEEDRIILEKSKEKLSLMKEELEVIEKEIGYTQLYIEFNLDSGEKFTIKTEEKEEKDYSKLYNYIDNIRKKYIEPIFDIIKNKIVILMDLEDIMYYHNIIWKKVGIIDNYREDYSSYLMDDEEKATNIKLYYVLERKDGETFFHESIENLRTRLFTCEYENKKTLYTIFKKHNNDNYKVYKILQKYGLSNYFIHGYHKYYDR